MTTGKDSPATNNMADDEDAQPEVLQPCAVCRRKFNPRSLEKHVKICERSAAKKRKPFDSAKQRIQGTELAEFLPKKQPPAPPSVDPRHQVTVHYEDRPIRKPTNGWKQTRDEFLKAIRAARGHNVSSSSQHQQYHNHNNQHGTHPSPGLQQRPSTLSLVTAPGAPMRANEKGQCPTCLRQFGIKSYERHVAFCKERSTRLPASPQIGNNVAKERFEARMKYRAPGLRNKRPTNREKYSPGSQKTVASSPPMTRTPTKDSSLPSKTSDNTTPKLPVLKRAGPASKESLSASTGPLKSRPIDRSNRSPDSQDSSNPPALRQLFTPRRLVLLSDVFPSTILQSKKSQLSNYSQKFNSKLVSNFLQKECAYSPENSSDSPQDKMKKKIKLKHYEERKKQNNEKNQIQQEDVVQWNNIRKHTADNENENEDDEDDEDEPNFSDVNGSSSLFEENYVIGEFEMNKETMSQHNIDNSTFVKDTVSKSGSSDLQLSNFDNERNSDLSHSNDSSNFTIDELYIAKGKTSSTTFNIDIKDNDNSDSDAEISSSSTKTFRKNDRPTNNIDVVYSLDSCHLKQRNEISENQKMNELIDTSRSYQIHDNKTTDNINKNELLTSPKKNIDQLNSFPMKCKSMINISDIKVKKVYEEKVIDVQTEKIQISQLSDNDYGKNIETIKDEPQIEEPKGLNRRCATYVIDTSNNLNNRQRPQQQQVNDDSSEEKPLKKRRKLHQRNRHNIDNNKTDDKKGTDEEDDGDDNGGDEDQNNDNHMGSSKNEMLEHDINKVPETQSLILNENKITGNVSEASSKSFVDFDYYRNKNPSISNGSTTSAEDQQILELEEPFEDDTESNASELIQEIDIDIMNSSLSSNLNKFTIPFHNPLDEFANSLKRLELSSQNSHLGKKEKRRKARLENFSSMKKNDTWMSSVEVSSLSNERADKSTQYFEKEICTITRLDSINSDESFLPNIGGKGSNSLTEWKERLKYHREKLVKSKPNPRVIELEKLREDEADSPKVPDQYPSNVFSPQIRRLSHFGWSFLRRSFERLPSTNWNSYGCRHPDFSMILRDRIGIVKDYDPFLLAEQQLNDLFSDTSDQSSTDGSSICPSRKPTTSPNLPLSQSSAFAKYPNPGSSQQQVQQQQHLGSTPEKPQQRGSLIAPPLGFDDPTSSDLSSDCAESQLPSREIPRSTSMLSSLGGSRVQVEREHVLGRRMIIDQSQALGVGEFAPSAEQRPSRTTNTAFSRLARPAAPSSRSISAPKLPERKISSSSSSGSSDLSRGCSVKSKSQSNSKSNSNSNLNGIASQQRVDSDLKSFNGSNLSLSSIISSTDMEIKRSNSVFDELLSTFEDEGNSTPTLPSLMTYMRNDPSLSSLSSKSQSQSNGLNGHHQSPSVNGRINSDDDGDSSSPESVKRQECTGKLSADSAYSSLNRKHSSYMRNTSDTNNANNKLKPSKFCHECGFKFPDLAKFCCECGVRRLNL